MPRKSYTARKRNERLWFEDNDVVVLEHPDLPTGCVLVSITGISGESHGCLIYGVEEVVSARRYPADARNLRPLKHGAERDTLIAEARARGESRGCAMPDAPPAR